MKWYIADYNGVLTDLKAKVNNHLATPRDADVWVVWQDCARSFGDLIKTIRVLGYNKPIYCVQHGGDSTRDYGEPNKYPFLSDKYLCWGKSDFDRLTGLGYGDKAKIVGCPLNRHIRTKVQHPEKLVLFIPINSGKEEPENIAAYYELLRLKYNKAKTVILDNKVGLKSTWGFDGKLTVPFKDVGKDFDVIAKLLPGHDKALYHGNTVSGYQDGYQNNRLLFNLLANVDLVVGLDEGTTELFAYAHDVPVVVCDGFRYAQGQAPYVTKAALHTSLEDLEDAVEYCLQNPTYKQQERKEIAELELGLSYGNATENIFKLVREDAKAFSSL